MTDPLEKANAPNFPFDLAEYQVPELAAAVELDAAAHLAFAEAEQAGAIGDAYVLATLLLAVVLFLRRRLHEDRLAAGTARTAGDRGSAG